MAKIGPTKFWFKRVCHMLNLASIWHSFGGSSTDKENRVYFFVSDNMSCNEVLNMVHRGCYIGSVNIFGIVGWLRIYEFFGLVLWRGSYEVGILKQFVLWGVSKTCNVCPGSTKAWWSYWSSSPSSFPVGICKSCKLNGAWQTLEAGCLMPVTRVPKSWNA